MVNIIINCYFIMINNYWSILVKYNWISILNPIYSCNYYNNYKLYIIINIIINYIFV